MRARRRPGAARRRRGSWPGEYTERSAAPSGSTDERDEDAIAVRSLVPFVAVAGDDGEQLPGVRADREDEAAARGELVAQLLWDGRGTGGDDDPIPRRAGRVTE